MLSIFTQNYFMQSRLGATIWRLVEYVRILPINRAWPKPHENEKLKVENECVRKWTEGEQRHRDRRTERQRDNALWAARHISISWRYFAFPSLLLSLPARHLPSPSSLTFCVILPEVFLYFLCWFGVCSAVVWISEEKDREREWGRERRR